MAEVIKVRLCPAIQDMRGIDEVAVVHQFFPDPVVKTSYETNSIWTDFQTVQYPLFPWSKGGLGHDQRLQDKETVYAERLAYGFYHSHIASIDPDGSFQIVVLRLGCNGRKQLVLNHACACAFPNPREF